MEDELDTAQDIMIESYYKEKGNLESLFLELTSEEHADGGDES